MFVTGTKIDEISYTQATQTGKAAKINIGTGQPEIDQYGNQVYIYNYTGFITAASSLATIKSQTPSETSKIEFYDSTGTSLLFSDMQTATGDVSMPTDTMELKVIVRSMSGDNASQEYTLTIQKSSSATGIKFVLADTFVQGTMTTWEGFEESPPLQKSTIYPSMQGDKAKETAIVYRVELPLGSALTVPRVATVDPYAYIVFDDANGNPESTYWQEASIPGYNGASPVTSVNMTNLNEKIYTFTVWSRGKAVSTNYAIRIVNSPEGTQIARVDAGGRKEGYTEYPITDESQIEFKRGTINGLTTFTVQIPYIEDQKTTTLKITPENNLATVDITNGRVHPFVPTLSNPTAPTGIVIDDIYLNQNGLQTEVPVRVWSPSGTHQDYKIYIIRYKYPTDLAIEVNGEMAVRESVESPHFERPSELSFSTTQAVLNISIADSMNKYLISVNGSSTKIPTATIDTPFSPDGVSKKEAITTTVPLTGKTTVVTFDVYSDDNQFIRSYDVTIRRKQLNGQIGEIRVNDNDVDTVVDDSTGELIYEAYSYTSSASPTAKTQIRTVNNSATITLIGITNSGLTYAGTPGTGYFEANVALQEGDNFFYIQVRNPDGGLFLEKLNIKHIPVDVYLDDLYATKAGDSTHIPFENTAFKKTVTSYTIKADSSIADYDIYAKAYETKEALEQYAIAKGWTPLSEWQTKIKITDTNGDHIVNLNEYVHDTVQTMTNGATTVPDFFRIPIYLIVPGYKRTYYIDIHNPSSNADLKLLEVIDYTIDPNKIGRAHV